MIMYTMMPHEMIFPVDDEAYTVQRTILLKEGIL